MYYHIAAGFICGQEEEDPVFYNLATQVGKIGVSCLLKIGCYVSQRSLCFFFFFRSRWLMHSMEGDEKQLCISLANIVLSCFMCFYDHLGQSNGGNGQ